MVDRRVVVTGIGLVTPLADGVEASWVKLLAGECAIRIIEKFDVSDIPVKIAAMVPKGADSGCFDLLRYIPDAKEHRKIEDFISFGVASCIQAVQDSGLDAFSEEDRKKIGVIMGSGIGGLSSIEKNSLILQNDGYKRISPFFIPASLINLTAGHVAIKYGFGGICDATVTACATGLSSIVSAARMIKCGESDIIVAGSSEAALSRVGLAGFNAMRALSVNNDNPQQASRPWDKKRDGFVMGEGAASLVLEEYQSAKNRGAKIYAEIIGYGATCDAYHMAAPSPDGLPAAQSMKIALKMSGKRIDDVDYINAHATSTPLGDASEIKAIRKVFGDAKNLAISSTKGAIGHLLGAAGSVEAIFTILAMNNSIMPPTINLEEPDEICDGLNLIPNESQEKKLDCVMSNSFGFGGTNYSVIFAKV